MSKGIPPDRLPCERHEVWPGVYTPPFHYNNPPPASSGKSMEAVFADIFLSKFSEGRQIAKPPAVEEDTFINRRNE